MTAADPLRAFYQSLSGRGALPLDPGDDYYVEILQAEPAKDPILKLAMRIELAESESVDLLTGFRGNGKSTELKRLKGLLEQSGCRVFLVDMLDYLLMTKPLELSDFVLSLMAALAQAVERAQLGELKPLTRSFWERLTHLLTAELQLEGLELGGEGGAAQLGFRLKTEPEFKERVQQRLRGHLGRLIREAREYVDELVREIRKREGEETKVVLLVDSVEQLRGVGSDAEQVHKSVVELFSGQAVNLAFPKLHLVYTIPPYLTALAQNLGRNLGGHPIAFWPNVHVRTRQGNADPAGLAVMEEIVRKRFPAWETVLPRPLLQRLAQSSGGDLRDYFRLVRECVLALRTARLGRPETGPEPKQVDEAMAFQAEEQLRNELLPLAEADARWLARIHAGKETALPTTEDLPALARFLDGNLIMNYLNGRPWFDIHPLLVEEIRPYLPPAAP